MRMTRIGRTALAAALLLAGCAEGTTPTTPVDPLLGVYVLESAEGRSPPAFIFESIVEEESDTVHVFVVSDTLELLAGGRYLQRARLEGRRPGGQLLSRSRWWDRGVVSREGGTLHLESDYFQNVRAEGSILGAGRVQLVQDLAGEGGIARYVMRRVAAP